MTAAPPNCNLATVADRLTVCAELPRKQEGLNVVVELPHPEGIHPRLPCVDRELPLDLVSMVGHFAKLSNLGQRSQPFERLHSVGVETMSEVVPDRLTGVILGRF